MAFRPRWIKIVRDMWRGKARSLLVVLSITIGVVGVGALGQAQVVLFAGMEDSLAGANPAGATLLTDPFDRNMAEAAGALPSVAAAEARTGLDVRLAPDQGEREPAPENWRSMQLLALDDFAASRMDRLLPAKGAWPPAKGEVLLEQTALAYTGVSIGDRVWIELPDGRTVRLRVSGAVRDAGRIPASLSGVALGYIKSDTLEALGVPKLYNLFAFQPKGDKTSADNIQKTAADIRGAFYAKGIKVQSTAMPEPGKHWAYDIVGSMYFILQSLGFLVLVLGASLVVNTILATLAGQLRQIGVMQVIGATPGALMRMYITSVLFYCFIALLIGIPLGYAGSKAITMHSIDIMNFDTSGYGISWKVLALQGAVGLVIPLLAPILRGTRISAREAIAGGTQKHFGRGFVDRVLERVQGLPRPLLLSLRNTFRKKGRLALTLVTLSLGGAIVVSVMSVYESMQLSLQNSLNYANYDVRVTMAEPQPGPELTQVAKETPGVVRTEIWRQHITNRIRPQGGESRDLTLLGVPAGSDFIKPTLEKGRWLQPGDRNALVVNTDLLRFEKDLDVGTEVRLKIGGKETVWTVVGLARKLVGEVAVYVPDETLAQAAGDGKKASIVQAVTDRHDRASEARIAADIQSRLKDRGLRPASAVLTAELKDVQQNRFGVVLAFLIVMAVLMTIVAALGLMGTMSLNVLERTREIGIIRSIDAGDRAVLGIILTEGVLIGLISWVFGTIMAIPVSRWLSDGVGNSIFYTPLDYSFSIGGVFVWLATAVLIAAAASFAPAWNASRLAVREVLAYE